MTGFPANAGFGSTHAVLAHQRRHPADQGPSSPPSASGDLHHGLMMFEFFLFIVEYRHGSIVAWALDNGQLAGKGRHSSIVALGILPLKAMPPRDHTFHFEDV